MSLSPPVSTLPPPPRDYHFDLIAVGEPLIAEMTARNDFPITLDRKSPACEGELVKQLGEGERGGEFPRRPVHNNADGRRHERKILALSGRNYGSVSI